MQTATPCPGVIETFCQRLREAFERNGVSQRWVDRLDGYRWTCSLDIDFMMATPPPPGDAEERIRRADAVVDLILRKGRRIDAAVILANRTILVWHVDALQREVCDHENACCVTEYITVGSGDRTTQFEVCILGKKRISLVPKVYYAFEVVPPETK